MTIRSVSQARAELPSLLVMVETGEEVIISRAGKPIAKLVRIDARLQPRKLGELAGQIWISPDFDEPDPELEQLFYEGAIEPAP